MRGKEITSYWQKLKVHAFIMGKSIVMNMERGERLYNSLKMRGFTGKITVISRKLKLNDYAIVMFFLSIIVYLVFFIDLELFYKEVFASFTS